MNDRKHGFIANLFTRPAQKKDLTKITPRRPHEVIKTGGDVSNYSMLRGLYDGTVPELQFASPYAYTPISVPVSLIGIPLPVPVDSDEKTKERIKKLLDDRADEFQEIERTELIGGTAWRWVRYDAKAGNVVWESIPDESIVAMEIDVITGDIEKIYTHDKFEVTLNESNVGYAERKRVITKKTIEIKWLMNQGSAAKEINQSGVNRFGFMPIPFGHDCDDGEYRGHSAFSRIMRLMKETHDIHRAREEILADFKPKLIVETDDPSGWLANNGYGSDINHAIDEVFLSRFYLAYKDKESLRFEHLPQTATQQFTDAMKENYKLIVIGSGIPEIFWGGLATGNHASTESQTNMGIAYINGLREENNKSYSKLINQTLAIYSFVELTNYSTVRITWDSFDMMSEEVKAKVFQSVAAGLSSLVSGASATKEDLYYFMKRFYPSLPEQDAKEFMTGLNGMALHKAMSGASALEASDYQVIEDTEGNENGE